MQNTREANVNFPDLNLNGAAFETKNDEIILSELNVGIENQRANILDRTNRGLPAPLLRRRGET
jgi:hypothetical protein